MEILVLHPGALGDIILSLPALAALRRHSPGSRITVAGNTDYLPYSAWGHADRILSLSGLPLHSMYVDGDLPEEDAAWWNFYDLLISWTGSGNAGFEKKLSALRGATRTAGWRPEGGEPVHVSRLFMDSLHPWVPRQEQVQNARILLPEDRRPIAEEWLLRRGMPAGKPLLALHPGASGEAKRWPLERFRSVAAKLAQSHTMLIIEGPAEPGLGSELARGLLAEERVIAASLPLELLAALLSVCDAYLGNDSGISHLAAALGLRSLVIFGPTRPEQWAPAGASVLVIRDTSGCGGCALGRAEAHSCLDNIPVEEVWKRLAGMRPV